MSREDIGFCVFMIGVAMAVYVDNIALSDVGLVVAGIGLGITAKGKQ